MWEGKKERERERVKEGDRETEAASERRKVDEIAREESS